MHVRQEVLKKYVYWCGGCNAWYDGRPDEVEYASAHEEDIPFDDVGTYTAYHCHDPHGHCTLNRDDWTGLEPGDTAWICGDCNQRYFDEDDAVMCCK